jgi:hypothetical protein
VSRSRLQWSQHTLIDEMKRLRPIPLTIKRALDRDRRWSDPIATTNAKYQPNAKDTLPNYAYKLALRRHERGERPDFAFKPPTKPSYRASTNRQVSPPKPIGTGCEDDETIDEPLEASWQRAMRYTLRHG